MKKLILLFILITAIIEGCKKYEDGPYISFRSANKRLCGGTGMFTLTEFTVDGADSLSSYYDSLGLDFRFVNDDYNFSHICIMNGPRKDGNGTDLYWGWELIDNNKIFKVQITQGSSNGISIFNKNINLEWKFLKFKYENIILKTSYNNKEYIINLERK